MSSYLFLSLCDCCLSDCLLSHLKGLKTRWAIKSRRFNRLQVENVGQLSGQMAEMVGGVVETVGEEPEPESEDMPEQHEEEEELTKVSYL